MSVEGRKFGRYLLFDQIGAGGMASVHIGRLIGPVGFSRTVAIKRLHGDYSSDPEFVSMFLDEARLAARIQHPNVVQVLDVVMAERQLLLVMEYIRGDSLANLIRTPPRDKLPVPVALQIATDVLFGLHAAHEATSENGEQLGIVHRDVSPQNVMVGADGVARVTDFGIAKAAARASSTRDGRLKGKLAYMAPEQIQRRRLDRRVDVFAASVMIWELLAGERLFAAEDAGAVVGRILYEDVTPLRQRAPEIPIELEAVLMKGLSKNPDDRFATTRDMATALEAFRPARASDVAAWVASKVGPILRSRAERVTEIEQASSAPDGDEPMLPSRRALAADATAPIVARPADATSPGTEIRPGRSRPQRLSLWLGLFALVTVAIAVGVFALKKEDGPVPAASAGVLAVAVPSAAPAVSVSPAPSASVPVASAEADAGAPVRVRPASGPLPSRPKSKNCNPAYTVDSRGIRVYKPECLKK